MFSLCKYKFLKYTKKIYIMQQGGYEEYDIEKDKKYKIIISSASELTNDVRDQIAERMYHCFPNIPFEEWKKTDLKVGKYYPFLVLYSIVWIIILSNSDKLCVPKGKIISLLCHIKDGGKGENVSSVCTYSDCRGQANFEVKKSYILPF